IGATRTVTLIHQQLVIVESENLADTAAFGEQVAVLVSGHARRDVKGDNAKQLLASLGCGILNQCVLHNSDQSRAIWRDCQAFHALVGDAPIYVAADLRVAHRRQVWHEEAPEISGGHSGAGGELKRA